MSYPVNYFATKEGWVIPASETDEAGTQVDYSERHYDGQPVAYAGEWYAIQTQYRPFKRAIAEAAKEAQKRAASAAA